MSVIEIPVGIVCTEEYIPSEIHSAKIVGSGDVEVLSTPSMISFMEATAWKCVQKYLPENYTTVGIKVNIEHKAPAPIGNKIKVIARLIKQEKRRLVFEVKAFWKDIVIGEGIHERYIVDKEKFLNKLKKMIFS